MYTKWSALAEVLHYPSVSVVFELFLGLEGFEAAWCWADVKL